VNTQEHIAAKRLELNEVARVQPVAGRADRLRGARRHCARWAASSSIDRQSLATVAGGTLDFALRRAANVHWQALDVGKGARASLKGQSPRCLWFTGLSGSGKSTIANLVEKRCSPVATTPTCSTATTSATAQPRPRLQRRGPRGEHPPRGRSRQLMVDAGLIVLVSFISPFRSERRLARELFAPGEFIEVHVDTPLEVAEQRDVKGLYAKARSGELPNFTGIRLALRGPGERGTGARHHRAGAEQLAQQVVDRALQ
jgi:bifunctional enzyme CysN/CysC